MIFIAKYDYFKKVGTVKQYNVDDDFIEFLHLLQDNGKRVAFINDLTDDLVNAFDENAGHGWAHDNGIDFGISKSKAGAVKHLIAAVENYDDEEMAELNKAFSTDGGEDKAPMSDNDKNKLRGHAGIEKFPKGNAPGVIGGLRQ